MSWFSQAFNWIGDTVSNAIPNEIKNVVSDIIPNEIEKVIDPKNLLNANLNSKPSATTGVAPAGGAPTYDDTLLKAFNAQLAIEPKLLEANKLYQPQWLELQKQSQAATAQAQMDLMKALYPQAGTIEAAYQNQLRTNQLQQLQTTLPQYQQAFNSLTPGYAQAINSMGQLAQQATQQAIQPVRLANYEAQISNPYGQPQVPIQAPTQQAAASGALQLQQPVSAAQLAPSQLFPQGAQPVTQMQGPLTPQQLAISQAGGNPWAAQRDVQAPQQGLQNASAGQFASAISGPQLSSDLNRINTSSVNQYIGTMPGMREAAARMGMQANRELAAGRGLTAEEQRLADQSARSAYAARGTALGPQSVAAEILNRADVSNQRYQQRLQNAAALTGAVQNIYQPALTQSLARQQGAQDYNLGAQQQAYQQAMGREALLSSTQQAAFNQALQRGQAEQQRLQGETAIQAGRAQIGSGALGQLQQAQAPILQAYYQQPILQQTVGQAQTMGLANQQASGNTLFQPESSLAFQSAFLPYQANIALQQAQMQANAAKSAGTSSMIGNLGGAAIGALALFCWVAREVYGSETGTWKVFRSWMLEEAPAWLRNAYIKYGSKIADFIKDKPVLKAIIRKWMDSKIEAYLTA
jgi:hypothetical protein